MLKLPFTRIFSTETHRVWWKDRKIDWRKDYLSTFNHPHRLYICQQLRNLHFNSLFEIGCGPGANLVAIGTMFPQVALGGIDINPEAIGVAKETFPTNSVFEVGSADNIMMSDKSADLILSDMTLIYVGPTQIKKYLREAVRMARRNIVLSEFYHPSRWKRLRMTLAGRYTHNYPQLLESLGCSDIMVRKMPTYLWPGAKDNEYRYLITART